MKIVPIIHIGLGNVGTEVLRLVESQKKKIQHVHGIDLRYIAFFTSKGGYFQKNGITSNDYNKIQGSISVMDTLKKVKPPYILIDTTASDQTAPALIYALEQGSFVVISNKKPLSSSLKLFNSLQKIENHHLFYETTVGAGLPVIQTLQTLLETGDEIISIEGCFSGTLGFICSAIEQGVPYSDAVRQAQEKGFTEPDPRDDLSGLDVTRKALILGRMMGKQLELADVTRNTFFPKKLNSISVDEFMHSIQKYDAIYEKQFKNVLKKDNTFRYVATVASSCITVGLKEVPLQSSIGSLHGPDNIIVFRTKRYSSNPLVIQGPGAGVTVTAAGVFGDILTAAWRIV